MKTPHVAASVRQRLLALAQRKQLGVQPGAHPLRGGGLLCGLVASPHGERFLLQDAFVRHAAVAEPLNSAPSWNGPASLRPAAR